MKEGLVAQRTVPLVLGRFLIGPMKSATHNLKMGKQIQEKEAISNFPIEARRTSGGKDNASEDCRFEACLVQNTVFDVWHKFLFL